VVGILPLAAIVGSAIHSILMLVQVIDYKVGAFI